MLKVVSFIQLKIKKFLHTNKKEKKRNKHKLNKERKKEIHAKNLLEQTKKK
jgi:hypothetical protein